MTLRSFTYLEFLRITITTHQAHLHVMTSNPTNYEHNSVIRFQRSCVHKILLCFTLYKIVPQLLHILSNHNGCIDGSSTCYDSQSDQIGTHSLLYGFRGAAFTRSYYDESNSRNASWALNLISTFLLHSVYICERWTSAFYLIYWYSLVCSCLSNKSWRH